jgi:hypothetical protein
MLYASPPWQIFEDVVRRILEANNFSIQRHWPRGDAGFDFIGHSGNEEWAIEVKYYRTARAQPTLIEAAASRVVSNGKSAKARKGMPVVSCVLPTTLRLALEEKFGITFVDRVDLRNWASTSPGLVDELDAIVEAEPGPPLESLERREDPRSKSRLLAEIAPRPRETRGTALCDELKTTKRGKEAWTKYEDLCARILKYLFPNDLHGWHKQKRTDDGLSRFDFVCRVRPTTEFWRFLIDHLNSRYVLFEFKNYSGKIKQGQILTTEKYLLERGLRRVALILTRAGAEQDALKMAQSAMREHGKLMLIIGDDKVCEMLHMKDRGEDPSDCLFDLADDFLLRLPR